MTEILHSPLFALSLVLASFEAGQWLYRRCGQFPLLHPTISGAVAVAAVLALTQVPYQDFAEDSRVLTFLLGPATVALAVPMYHQLHLIRAMAAPILLTLLAGASFASLSAVAVAWLLDGEAQTLLSLASKSVTTPIAIGISENIGGLGTVAAGAVILTGVVGISTAPWIMKVLRIEDDRVWGFCLGLAAHAIGTARAFERSPVAGAFSSLALCLTGSLSAVLIPLAVQWLG